MEQLEWELVSTAPQSRKIYHITHVENISKIVDNVVWSDAERIRQGLECTIVGMSEIKRRRLEELEVHCHPGTKVGQYVPFYFCPRSIMLYILHRANSPGLIYQGGQRPIVHLQADLHATIGWASATGKRWAFSKGNAGAYYAEFFNDTDLLDMLDWQAIGQTDWRDPDVKEGKQAEFLVEESFPWELVERIGAIDSQVARQVTSVTSAARHRPDVVVAPAWYY